MATYTKEQIKELRGLLITARNARKEPFEPHSWTMNYLIDLLCTESDIGKLQRDMRDSAEAVRHIRANENSQVDYTLAYDLLFGDISVAPLHINDALESVATWRLKQPE
jgi:hypothetical protein